MIKYSNTNADTVIIVDFETTGMSPDHGDRAIERCPRGTILDAKVM